MDINSLIFLFAGIAVGTAFFGVLILLYPRVVERAATATGVEKDLENALLPSIYFGISAAYRTTERAVTEGYQLLSGEDKKRIADGIYNVLPEQIGNLDVSAVKRLVSLEQFEQLVQKAFDGFDSFFKQHQDHFDQEFEVWKQQHPLPVQPS